MIDLLIRRRGMVETEKPVIPYLCLEAVESGTFTFTCLAASGTDITNISYSLDGGNTWVSTDVVASEGAVITTPELEVGDKVLWKGAAKQFATSISAMSSFSSTGKFNVSGNILSMKYGSDILRPISDNTARIFLGIFINSKVVDASGLVLTLPATSYGYYAMFKGCTYLTNPPKLEFSSTASYGCAQMFYGCTSLVNAPDITMPSVGANGLREMFRGCSSLQTLKLMANSVGSNALYNWMNGVAAGGTFTKPSSLTLPSGASGIPSSWTIVDV